MHECATDPKLVDPLRRWIAYGHLPCVVWMTGLSGAGKTTLANALDFELFNQGAKSFVLDGDYLRCGLNSDLGFSGPDRVENARRVAHTAGLMAEAGMICIVAVVSPSLEARQVARACVPNGLFVEVHVNTPLEVCERRDPKGLYRKARSGLLKGLTGVDAPYEIPLEPDLCLDTSIMSVTDCIESLMQLLAMRGSNPSMAKPAPSTQKQTKSASVNCL